MQSLVEVAMVRTLHIFGSLFKEACMTASRQTFRLHAVDFKRLHSSRRLHAECLVTVNAALLKLRYYVTTAVRLGDCNTQF